MVKYQIYSLGMRSWFSVILPTVLGAVCNRTGRDPVDSPVLQLTPNCSSTTAAAAELPVSWEHGADCMLMNFCRWLGDPACGYEQACVGVGGAGDRADGTAPGSPVQTTVCDASLPALRWGFVAFG